MLPSEIQIWGDSLAVGITYDEQRQRYAISKERCTNRLSEDLPCKVVNNAKMGATVLDGLQRFEKAQPVEGALCVVEYGGNDCNLDWTRLSDDPNAEPLAKVEISVFTKKLEEFIEKIENSGMKAVLVTPLPLHAQRFFNWVSKGLNADSILHALRDVQSIYSWQERYAIAVRNVAEKMGTPLIDLRDAMLSNNNYPLMICKDGMHLCDEGYRYITDYLLQRAQLMPDCI
ncbi:MAG TPA: SGNH/GDSL hydrolase family protein [Candidatus Limiplasma sp.]|nr:SGNH/GDSL hydrolase family protein [Candidatus Limiplasma sp.]